jgi:DNA-binding IclR family transcriptional regulator
MTTPMNNSVIKAFKLLDIVKLIPEGLSLIDAAERAGMTVPTTHRFLRTLLSLGALDQTAEGRYIAGRTLRDQSQIPQVGNSPAAVLEHHVIQLAATLRETAHVAVLDGNVIRYIAKAETQRSLRIVTQLGTTLEAYCTGVGKMIIAYKSDNYVASYLQSGDFVALTDRTITDPATFLRELQKVRDVGYAVDNEEFEAGLRCVAAPIWVDGKVVAALSCSAPASRLTDANLPFFVAVTKRRAQVIAQELRQKRLSVSDV